MNTDENCRLLRMWANTLNTTHAYWVSYWRNSIWGVCTLSSTPPQALVCSQLSVIRLSVRAGLHANINFKGRIDICFRFRLVEPWSRGPVRRGAMGHCCTGSWSRGDWQSGSDRRQTRCGGREDSNSSPTRHLVVPRATWATTHGAPPPTPAVDFPLLSIIPFDSGLILQLITASGTWSRELWGCPS
jgi:hypothetical protein